MKITREQWLENQRNNGEPMFIPDDGYCRECGHDIAQDSIDHGGKGMCAKTGCSKCQKSYCD